MAEPCEGAREGVAGVGHRDLWRVDAYGEEGGGDEGWAWGKWI